MEAILITSTEPGLNRQGGRWGHAVHYLQVKDEKHITDRGRTEEIWEWMRAEKKAKKKAADADKKAKAKKKAAKAKKK
jgi:hypothetical protein